MSFDYDKSAKTAAWLINKFGLVLTFTRTTQGATHTPGQGSTDTTSIYQAIAAWLGYSVGEVDGENIQQGDAKLYCDPLQTAPEINDTVVYKGNTWRVIDVMPLSPAGTDVLYTVQVRR